MLISSNMSSDQNMFKISSLLLLCLTIVPPKVVGSNLDLTARDYHRRVGIPKAAAIKQDEERGYSRIVGGSYTDISNVPYQVGLIMQIQVVYHSVCGGSLVSHNRVVSAAHCYYDGYYIAESFTVVLGSNFLYYGGTRILTTDIVVHPNWDTNWLRNDIMVLRIPSVTFTNAIQPIALPSGSQISNNFAGQSALASGYGQLADDLLIDGNQRLSSVTVPVITHAQCEASYGVFAQPTNLCTAGTGAKGTCQGDSGGPIAVTVNGKPVLVGIPSFAHWNGCQAGQPAAHTRVTSYMPWLQTVI